MKSIVWPYKMGSKSARDFARALNTKRVYSNRRYRPKENHLIINWGNSELPKWWPYACLGSTALNHPASVSVASRKVDCLRTLFEHSVPTPRFFTRQYHAEDIMVHEPDTKMFCRTLTRANSGRGIVIATTPDELVPAQLYTADVGERDEYRVHVFNGEVIDYSIKKKLTTPKLQERGIEFCKEIRSYSNGWIFAREDVELPEDVKNVAIDAVNALGLDFAAIDCYQAEDEAGVFEVNTAPGIQGTTLERYVEAIQLVSN